MTEHRSQPKTVCKWAGAVFLSLCMLGPFPALAENGITLEARVRAAFLFNFARFTSWPDAADAKEDARLTYCIVNARSVADALRAATKNKEVAGLPVDVLEPDVPDGAASCDVIYLPNATPQWLAKALSRPTLLVGEGQAFAEAYGMVGFFVQDGRLRFAINAKHVRAAGLQMSSRLLGLATLVGNGGRS